MTEDITIRLKELLVRSLRLDCSPESVPSTNLTRSLGIDSINSLEFLVWVENEFEIEIDDGDLSVELVDSLDRLAAYIASRPRRGSAPEALRPAGGS